MSLVMPEDEIQKLRRDVRAAAASLGRSEARYLVDLYYQMQDYRLASTNQVRALSESGEPHSAILFMSGQTSRLERQVHSVLDAWTDSHELGRWSKSIVGIGPVISAGLLAHIDFDKAQTAGAVWRYSGIDPTLEWKKGEKRPWNAQLKTLAVFKLGESFVKFQKKEGCFYGQVFRQKKDQEIAKNERGELKSEAERALSTKTYRKDTEAYKWYIKGMLPPAHIHARARRYAVKLFIAHYFEVGYKLHTGKEPPKPYPIAILGHPEGHYIPPPNTDL